MAFKKTLKPCALCNVNSVAGFKQAAYREILKYFQDFLAVF